MDDEEVRCEQRGISGMKEEEQQNEYDYENDDTYWEEEEEDIEHDDGDHVEEGEE